MNEEGSSLEKIQRRQRLPQKALTLSQLFEETPLCFSHYAHINSQFCLIFCICNRGMYTQNYSTILVIILHWWLIRMWWYTTEYFHFSVFNLKHPENGPQKWALTQHLVFRWNIQIFWKSRIKVAWGTLKCSHLSNTLRCCLQWDKQVSIFPREFALFSTEKRQWLMVPACIPCVAEHVPQVLPTLSNTQAELWRHILSFMIFPMKLMVPQYLKVCKILHFLFFLLLHVFVSWTNITASCIEAGTWARWNFKMKSIY